jgi:uncharacterized membrane protein
MTANATNLRNFERIASTTAGIACVLRAFGRPSFARLALFVGGAFLMQRGLTGHCQLSQELGLRSSALSAREYQRRRRVDVVHTASDDSFPASDPPAWTPVAGIVADR